MDHASSSPVLAQPMTKWDALQARARQAKGQSLTVNLIVGLDGELIGYVVEGAQKIEAITNPNRKSN